MHGTVGVQWFLAISCAGFIAVFGGIMYWHTRESAASLQNIQLEATARQESILSQQALILTNQAKIVGSLTSLNQRIPGLLPMPDDAIDCQEISVALITLHRFLDRMGIPGLGTDEQFPPP